MENQENKNQEQQNTHKKSLFEENNEDIFSSGSSSGFSSTPKTFVDKVKYTISDAKEGFKTTNEQYNESKVPQESGKRIFSIVLIAIMILSLGIALFFSTKSSDSPVVLGGAIVFGVCLVILIMSVIISEKRHLKPPTPDCIKRHATVVSCTQSSTTTYANGKTKITFKVIVDIDGEKYTSYSHCHFPINSDVIVYTKEDPKQYCHVCSADEHYDF